MTPPTKKLRDSRAHLVSMFSQGKGWETFQEDLTEIVDHYFRRSLQESGEARRLFREKTPIALVALGGYGRRELCLHSDIDVMLLFPSRIPSGAKRVAEEILYPLWDLGFDLGHGTRTVKDCLHLSMEDFEVMTSLMDARFICGESPTYLSLMEKIEGGILRKRAHPFIRWLEEKNTIRMASFGDATHLLEPNLKDGIGGLRDYHNILWLAKAFYQVRDPRDLEYTGKLTHGEYEDLQKNLAFIRLVRNHLHYLSGRKNDRLTFDYQEKIAAGMGFRGQNGLLAVEQFLSRLHGAMGALKSLHASFLLHRLNDTKAAKGRPPIHEPTDAFFIGHGGISFRSAAAIPSNPFLLSEIFEQGCRLGVSLSLEAERLVREFLYLVDERYRTAEIPIRGFLAVLNHPGGHATLDRMFETRYLDALFPEFHQVRDRVQYDAYHLYPVGVHALQTLLRLKSLAREKDLLLLTIFSDLTDPEPLFLAGLFHDIGKTGKNHARRGASVTGRILKRMGYDDKRARDILFLVRHHLLLAETATRRDLNDEKVIVQCARTVGDITRLKMLYLLTWADSKATGPRAWNEWTANLVQELFFKVLHTLERGELASPNAARHVRTTLARLRREMPDQEMPAEVDALFDLMPPRYVLETRFRDILRHIRMYRNFRKVPESETPAALEMGAREQEAEACWEVTFLAKDRPGLFSDLAGVLALNNINILSARIYTWRDGTAMDIFKVTSPLDPIRTEETWEKVRRDLGDALSEKISLPYRLGKKAEPSILSPKAKPVHPPNVRVDNASSDFFTLVEVFADDEVGVLYRITRALFELGLDIRIAKISTKGDQIADVFYVRDLDGQKVVEKARVKEIERALLHRLGQG